jgi:DmsE family decaheme c-type cytochrome
MLNIEATFALVGLIFAALSPAAAQDKPPEFVGSETCQTCHEDIYNDMLKSPHSAVERSERAAWKGRACESCHGPGGKHAGSVSADDIRNPAKITAALVDKTCLACHAGGSQHAGRILSSHVKNEVSCVACHKIHANGPMGLVARKAASVNELCVTCHVNIWAQFQKPNHHKLPEGAMSCVDCHNPHGGGRTALTKAFAGNDAGCFQCHGDKRGPFTFEHAVVRFEGCVSCHEPHGSANPRMLNRAQVSQVCLECHTNLPSTSSAALGVVPPAFHDLRSPRFQNCTVCHQKVHGSHVDRFLLK